MIASVTRRQVLILAMAGRLSARSHIVRARVSAVTDEIGKSQAEAIEAALKYKIQMVELRRVPESGKDFAGLTDAELKHVAAELGVAKLKVAMLHAGAVTAEAIRAAGMVGAAKLVVPEADVTGLALAEAAKLGVLVKNMKAKDGLLDWDPVKDPDGYVKGRVGNVRVQIAAEDAGWRRRFEALDRDGYGGGVSLETTVEKSDDGLHDLLRLVDSL